MTEPLPHAFTIRACLPGDRESVMALVATCETEEEGSSDPGMLDAISITWQRSDFDGEHNAWLALNAESQQVLGYAQLQPAERPDLQAFATVHPEARGRGIGTALLERVERRAGEQLAQFAPDDRIVIQQWLTTGNQSGRRLLERSGYAAVRHNWSMIVELAEAPVKAVWPQGITIRTAGNDDDLRAAHAAYEDAFQDHWGHTEQSYEEFARSMIDIDTFDPSLWFMAMDGSQVAGIALGELLPDRGWVNDLAVRRAWRGRGLGGALLRHTFGEFYRRGLRSVGLGVDSQNLTGATRLYERAGMRIEREYSIYEIVLRPANPR
jgi:mycothiol synthase